MQQPVATQPAGNGLDFAGIFSTLANPGKQAPPSWDDDGLANDIATLSYESALRRHGRNEANRVEALEPLKEPVFDWASSTASTAVHADSSPDLAKATAADLDRKSTKTIAFAQSLKRASVTIRLSESEFSQLRLRADEAGMTISAYLRSCTFEAERLRAMVKDALTQLKNAKAAAAHHVAPGETTPVAASKPQLRWWQRLWPWALHRNAIA